MGIEGGEETESKRKKERNREKERNPKQKKGKNAPAETAAELGAVARNPSPADHARPKEMSLL